MQDSLKMRAAAAIPVIRPFLSSIQLATMGDACRGEEKEFFMQKFIDLAQLIEQMPATGEQEGRGGRAIAHLHYFLAGSHWYILEKDMDGGVLQAYGYAILNGMDDFAECGYISIEELTRFGAELDLHFVPRSLAEVQAERAGQAVQEQVRIPKPWVVVTKPGQDDEEIWGDFQTYQEAVAELGEPGEPASIMKRLDDGTLTTEY